jgi:hypothetical protein
MGAGAWTRPRRGLTVLLTLLNLALTLNLTLALSFLSSQMPPNTVLSGSVADVTASHSVENLQEKIFPAYLRPCAS